ncbi:multidrug resistance efflux transporter family protein [Paraburkholderia megapolitana]|nr:multidrug resistance efflux transporter family protein [Paraburkholderia megapolitana]
MTNPSTFRLVLIGIVSSAFFSATFLLNEVMHLQGGHWLWSAALRFLFMLVLLSAILPISRGSAYFRRVVANYFRNLLFWTLAGGIGFGVFYSGICLAADFAHGWVVAATWQLTVLASPFVLMLFGKKMPRKGLTFSFLIVVGVLVLNYGRIKEGIAVSEVIHGALPALIAAIAYPIGNQFVNSAKHNQLGRLRLSDNEVLENPMACVLLMSLGSVPYWLALIFAIQPPAPSAQQFLGSFMVALLAGVCATSLFYFARNSTTSAMQIAAVDATLAGEVVITLVAGIAFMHQPIPDLTSWVGVLIIVLGLIGYCYKNSS